MKIKDLRTVVNIAGCLNKTAKGIIAINYSIVTLPTATSYIVATNNSIRLKQTLITWFDIMDKAKVELNLSNEQEISLCNSEDQECQKNDKLLTSRRYACSASNRHRGDYEKRNSTYKQSEFRRFNYHSCPAPPTNIYGNRPFFTFNDRLNPGHSLALFNNSDGNRDMHWQARNFNVRWSQNYQWPRINQQRYFLESSCQQMPRNPNILQRHLNYSHGSRFGSFFSPRTVRQQFNNDNYIIKPVHRQWEKLNGPNSLRGKLSFTLASYNVLAQNLLDDHMYLYKKSPQYTLDWNYRQKLILSELKYFQPKILCLQEVHHQHLQDFYLPQLDELGYKCLYQCRTGDKQDGCAIFYQSTIKLLSYEKVKFVRPDVPNLNRDNIALVAKLELGTRKFIVANTHLLFNPKRGDVKLAQIILMLAHINSLRTDETCPVIVCGDMNTEPHSPLYNFFREGTLKYWGLNCSDLSSANKKYNGQVLGKEIIPKHLMIDDNCTWITAESRLYKETQELRNGDPKKSAQAYNVSKMGDTMQGSGTVYHNLKLTSVYQHYVQREGLRFKEFTTHHDSTCSTVDYIFYSRSKGDGLSCTEYLKLFSEDESGKIGMLPNKYFGSDHTMLLAKFSM